MIACSVHAEKTAERTISPLIGTWTRDGFITRIDNSSDPRFTKLTFAPDGALKASYLPAGIGAVIGTYSTSEASKLSIAEGTTHREYFYRVSGSKLYLTPPGGGDAAIFTKASSTELH